MKRISRRISLRIKLDKRNSFALFLLGRNSVGPPNELYFFFLFNAFNGYFVVMYIIITLCI